MMPRPEKDHYEVLGIPKLASKNEIRDAYRKCAREAHPDTMSGSAVGSITSASARMAEISQAWAVLSDPERRRQYDALSFMAAATQANETQSSEPETKSETKQFVERARVPWRFLLVLLFLGIIFVLIIDSTSEPAVPRDPDGLVGSGSCVIIDDNLTAVEVRCEDAHDGVVRQLVGFDMKCPRDTEAIRDRQGLGIACVVRD